MAAGESLRAADATALRHLLDDVPGLFSTDAVPETDA